MVYALVDAGRERLPNQVIALDCRDELTGRIIDVLPPERASLPPGKRWRVRWNRPPKAARAVG